MLSCWSAFLFGGIVAGFAACGGSIVTATGSEAGADGAGHLIEAATSDQSCSIGSDCVEDAPDGSGGHDGGSVADVETGHDVVSVSDGSLACGYHTGPLAPGIDAGGPSVVCSAGWICTNLNGGWACCTVEGSSGVSMCLQPFLTDGG